MSELIKANVDRFEGNQAVLFINERTISVLRNLLPKGVSEGDWLEVEFDGERFVRAKIDAKEKEKMKKRIKEKLAKLRSGNK